MLQDHQKDFNTHGLVLMETTQFEVIKLFNNMEIRKASYIYGISPKLVKLLSQYIKKYAFFS